MSFFTAQVITIKPLTDKILQVMLELAAPLDYASGQYLEIITRDEQHMPFSIANAPLGSRQLELHIRHTPDNSYSTQLVAEIKQYGEIQLAAPLGVCTYQILKPQLPIIFMAGGSGFAPIKAIIEQIFTLGPLVAMHLYWGVKTVGDLYLDELAQGWAKHVPLFQYTPVLSQDQPLWLGRKGLVFHAILQDYVDLSGYQVLAAGPFDMVLTARTHLLAQGLLAENMYSDAFSFVS